jgi:hypothetical protein
MEETDATAGLAVTDIIEFYREHLAKLKADPALKIGCFRQVTAPTIQLGLVAKCLTESEASELSEQSGSSDAMNFYRFELAKASLVVGSSTHGPGHTDGTFASPAGDEMSSQELAYRHWFEGLAVHYHPLGVIVDSELCRPVISDPDNGTSMAVSDPIFVNTYRGSTGKPWQFGVTRHEDQILITQARAGPAKFDPVLKRFPIQTEVLGDEPLVFSHTVSRRVWNADPLNDQVQSQRSEGLRTQFLYADSDGWHLIQPKTLGEPTETRGAAFEPTQLGGVSVRSTLLRSETAGEMKTTVEHEYRITEDVFDSCTRVYALSYFEANEESIDRLQWDIADAAAYEIVRSDGEG